MHVAIFADIEGAFGIWRMRQCRTGTREWEYGRECLTADVNQIIRGAFDGGADRVTVKDTHDTGFNCLKKKLDRRAKYIGGHFLKPSLFGDLSDIDLVLYGAIHAASGTPNAFFSHTHYGVFSEVLLNGKPVCEMDIYGSYLGEFGVPIGFVSGEDIAVEQALRALPWAKSVVVDKRKEAYTSGEESLQYLKHGRETLRTVAADAVREASHMKPYVIPGPLSFEVVFRDKALADRLNTWGFQQSGTTVSWQAANMKDGFDLFNRLTFIPKRLYPIRAPMFFLVRSFSQIRNNLMRRRPNREDAVFIE